MKIDDAIKALELLKKDGTKNVMIGYWEPYCFGMEEGKKWELACDAVDSHMDWSLTHEMLEQIITEETE